MTETRNEDDMKFKSGDRVEFDVPNPDNTVGQLGYQSEITKYGVFVRYELNMCIVRKEEDGTEEVMLEAALRPRGTPAKKLSADESETTPTKPEPNPAEKV